MSKRPTPLAVFVRVLTGQTPPEDAQMLRALAREHATTRRAKEIAEYLIAAAEERLPRGRKAGGSLKHVLYWLRDNAGDLYESAAGEVFRYLLEHPEVSLTNVLPFLRHLGVAGVFADQIARAQDSSSLRRLLQERRCGSWRVAVYTGERNLTNIAMRAGFDVYVARSRQGAVVKARRGLRVDASCLPQATGWLQRYPDLAIWTGEPEDAPGVDDILAVLENCVKGGG